MTAHTRQTAVAAADIAKAREELDWLERNLPDLDVIANSAQWSGAERVQTSRPHVDTGPVLSEQGQVRNRRVVRDACRTAHKVRVDLTAARVSLEGMYGGPGADHTLIGTLLEPGELKTSQLAKQRRDANAGDPRYGEWEATTVEQPGPKFRG